MPNLAVVPQFADAGDDHAGQLDLLPGEWEVLTMIDGQRDLRRVAVELARSEFDVAKIVYGLLSTGVVSLRPADRRSRAMENRSEEDAERQAAARALVLQGLAAAAGGRLEDALRVWSQYLASHGSDRDAPAVRDGVDAVERLRRALEVLRGN